MNYYDAKHVLERGAKYPYDAPDSWWESSDSDTRQPLAPVDWAHAAARGILADLQDRGGIKHELDGIDEGTRKDIVDSLAAIVREAHPLTHGERYE